MEQRNNPKSNENCQHKTPSKRPRFSFTCQPLALQDTHLLPTSLDGMFFSSLSLFVDQFLIFMAWYWFLWSGILLKALDFREMNKAGDRLIAATSLVINNQLWFLHPCENICSVSSKKNICSVLLCIFW
jgi:hypothetical protein